MPSEHVTVAAIARILGAGLVFQPGPYGNDIPCVILPSGVELFDIFPAANLDAAERVTLRMGQLGFDLELVRFATGGMGQRGLATFVNPEEGISTTVEDFDWKDAVCKAAIKAFKEMKT